MSILTLVKTANRPATVLTAAAVVILLVKGLFLNRFPASSSVLFDLGVIADAVLTSVVASYIFYLLVVHLKEERDKDTLAPYINQHTLRVVGNCRSQLSEFAKASGIALDLATVDVESLTVALSKIAPYSNAPLILSPSNMHANWIQYLEYNKNRSKESIAKVLAQIIYLQAEHVSLLTAVDDCSHFSLISHMLHTKISNSNMSVFASSFMNYCQACQRVENYMRTRGAAV